MVNRIQAENTDGPSTSAGYRLAIRGAILTDLRRMHAEVRDVVEMTSHPSLNSPQRRVSGK